MSQQINLFNPAFEKQRTPMGLAVMLPAWGLALVLAVAAAFALDSQVSKLALEATTASSELKQTQAQLGEAMEKYAPRQKSKALEEEIERAQTELNSQKEVFSVVSRGGMGNTKGYSEYLRAFARQITTGIWLTGLDIIGPGSEINLRGRALQAEALPAYINRLKSEPVMLGKTFSMLEMQVPSVDTETKDDKGSKVMKSGLASFIEFSLQTKVTEVDPNEASPMESTKPNSMQLPGLFKDAGKSGGMLAK